MNNDRQRLDEVVKAQRAHVSKRVDDHVLNVINLLCGGDAVRFCDLKTLPVQEIQYGEYGEDSTYVTFQLRRRKYRAQNKHFYRLIVNGQVVFHGKRGERERLDVYSF